MINFPDHFLFFYFFCTLKYVNMITISNITFFRFCWKNRKLDWPKCARTVHVCRLHGQQGQLNYTERVKDKSISTIEHIFRPSVELERT